MAQEKNAVTDFLNEVSPTKDIFKEEPAEAVIEEEEKEEKPLPFHQDPKVQRYVQKQIEKALKDVRPTQEQQFKKEVEDINLPSSFVKLVGNDTEEKRQVLKDMSTYFDGLKGQAKQEFLKELEQQEAQAREADTAALNELSEGFEEIEDQYGVDLDSDRKTRTAFVEFLRQVSPKNQDGEVKEFADIVSTFETFQKLNKPQSATRAKALASRGLARSSDTSANVPKGRTWKDVDRYFAQLKSQGN